jgi:hypothetical protein
MKSSLSYNQTQPGINLSTASSTQYLLTMRKPGHPQTIFKKEQKMTMMAHQYPSWIFINDRVFITREQLNTLLKTYNIFYENKKNLHILYGQA